MLTIAAASPAHSFAQEEIPAGAGFGPLKADPNEVIDLPAGFSYTVVSERGQEMDDGLLVPGLQDGMAAFPGENGQIILVCNHETAPYQVAESALGLRAERFERVSKNTFYDKGLGKSPALGGTTTIHYDPVSRRRTHMHMSLMGTEINCAGGPTPWGSWLTCEECFYDAGTSFERGYVVHRESKHGYIFEVPANAMEVVDPVPLKHMGRFEHEAAAINPATGVVYLTEDRHQSLLYRFLPNVPGRLREGGRLQALGIKGESGFDTRNWIDPKGMAADQTYEATWIDLEEPDVPTNDLRLRGAEKGATIFARGEGICYADGEIIMAATIGGPERLGQLFAYTPSAAEGTDAEEDVPGKFRLLAESTSESVLRHADNITQSPWGDLIACEDTRTSSKLLNHLDIRVPKTSYHDHNERSKTPQLIAKMLAGQNIALITDAGSPGISDPGFYLVRACIEQGIKIEALPGPTAIIPALTVSGLPSERFVFEGFLPVKKGRQTRLAALKDETRTMVFYESPHRIIKTLTQFEETFGEDRPAAVIREISKTFEEVQRGSIAELKKYFSEKNKVKGEFVVVVKGNR